MKQNVQFVTKVKQNNLYLENDLDFVIQLYNQYMFYKSVQNKRLSEDVIMDNYDTRVFFDIFQLFFSEVQHFLRRNKTPASS